MRRGDKEEKGNYYYSGNDFIDLDHRYPLPGKVWIAFTLRLVFSIFLRILF
jgi:hypothetical protein